ncbi:MAG: SRPBCC family protein [Terriglobia bacterium]
MNEIRTEIQIQASAQRVWEVLTDFPSYSLWNSVLHPIQGEVRPGGQLRVRVRPLTRPGIRFRAMLLCVEPARELRWVAKFIHHRVFSGEHSFTIEPIGNGAVRFVQREVYTGLLVPLIMLVLASRNRRAFEEMNRALKARAEEAHKLP